MARALAETLLAEADGLAENRVVILPDLFIDHLVPVPSMADFRSGLARVVGQGGGNVILPGHRIQLGGNAANTAYATARLGLPTTLIAQSDDVGRLLWKRATRGLPTHDRGIRDVGHPSSTVALELKEESANLMLSDPGPLAGFGPDDLDEEAWRWVEDADLVAVMNWAQMLEHGTELVARVVQRARESGTFTYIDTGDPAHRAQDARGLLSRKGLLEGIGAWGMNEHEARWFAGLLLEKTPDEIDVETAAGALHRHTTGRVDIHTHAAALSIAADETVRLPAYPLVPDHRTGAGDAWNAGNIVGTLLALTATDRLRLAHATAALTLTGERPGPPTMHEVIDFLSQE